MAKTYLNTVKYMIHIDFGISGIVEKPDIIGAIFGQSEGLLGEDMDLKELQKNGKVGRIEINAKSSLGKTKGEILVPSSMDTAQTSILAAAVELVDKVGPCDAKFNITNIEDVRGAKRDLIKGRAQELLQKMMKEQMPESEALADEIRGGVRKAKICAYGRDKIPAGPDIDDSEEIIVVEGRADVLNLLKNGIKNVIGMGGSQISPTVIQLSRRKKLTVFIDGDRGGELNARKLKQIASVAYIAHAPDGKEVEELAGKEILLALKRKVSIGDEKPARRDSNGGRGEGNGYGPGNYGDRRDSRPEYPGGNGERSGSREGSYSDRRPEYGSGNRDSRPSYGSDRRDSRPAYGSGERRDSRPSYGSDRRDSRPSYGSGERESRPSYGSDRRDSRPSYGSDRRDSRPSYG
ncbi:DNA primase, partial [Candidatus Micrarchaeota archaeon]|nr:DNA primase [Candidatus Micrarchaeota archaeon]